MRHYDKNKKSLELSKRLDKNVCIKREQIKRQIEQRVLDYLNSIGHKEQEEYSNIDKLIHLITGKRQIVFDDNSLKCQLMRNEYEKYYYKVHTTILKTIKIVQKYKRVSCGRCRITYYNDGWKLNNTPVNFNDVWNYLEVNINTLKY